MKEIYLIIDAIASVAFEFRFELIGVLILLIVIHLWESRGVK